MPLHGKQNPDNLGWLPLAAIYARTGPVAAARITSSLCAPVFRHGGFHSGYQHLDLKDTMKTRSRTAAFASSADKDNNESQPSTSQPKSSNHMHITLPTALTLARVAAVPLLIVSWFWQSQWSALVSTSIFVVAAVTDWLDGYLARKMNLHSEFGAFLDPVADKLMVATVLILVSTKPIAMGFLAGNEWLMPLLTLAIIGREITMSALREWAASASKEARKAVAVNNWGKWKTATQMVALALLLACKDGGQGLFFETAANLGPLLLVVAAWLTVHSLAIYIGGLWRFLAH